MAAGLLGQNGPHAATAVVVDGKSAPGPAPILRLSTVAPFAMDSPCRRSPAALCAQVRASQTATPGLCTVSCIRTQ